MHAIEVVPDQLFGAAMAHFRAGNRALAAGLCREILETSPHYPDANHLLGVILLLDGDAAAGELFLRAALQVRESAQTCSDLALTLKRQKRLEEAAGALRRAIELEPRFALAHSHLGGVLEDQGDAAGAEAAFRRALELNPASADAHYRLGKLLALSGRAEAARQSLQRAVELRPKWAEAHNSLGTVLAELGLSAQAESAFRYALEVRPGFAEAHCNLGTLLEETGRLEEAEKAYRAALSVDSGFGGASEALAKLMSRLGRREEAIQAFRKAVSAKPDDAGALNALGALLAEGKRFEEAEPVLQRAVELSPAFTAALSNLGSVLMETGRLTEAESSFRKALQIDTNHWGAAYNLGLLLKNTRRLDEAEVISRRVIELKPRMAAAQVALGNVLMSKATGDIGEVLNCFRRGIELDPDCHIAHSNLVYALNFVSETGLDVLEEGRRFAAHFEAPHASRQVKYENDRSASRRLRIGYVSPDFRNHCQALFMMPVLRNHDHEAVEVYCYSSVSRPDHITREMMQFADVWRDVHLLDNNELAAQIQEDRIDVLVDLTMHMSNGRLEVFARRPAPVQVAWLAYPGTTGVSSIGYRFTDPWLDPAQDTKGDERYSERSIRLPDTFWCYDSLEKVEVNPLPADTAGHITFGCLNNPCKLTSHTFDLWANVMKQVPHSRLVLLLAQGEAREIVSASFEARGIERTRLTLVDYQPRPQYLRAYHQIDIVLDTFPYNGHTTSLDALWMGVPVATVIGATPASRAGYSLLSNLGMVELAAASPDEFVAMTAQLASNLPRLRAIRAGLRERMEKSPLMDGARFARGLEAAYRRAWLESGMAVSISE